MHVALSQFLDALPACENEKHTGHMLLSFFQDMGADGGNIWFASGRSDNKATNASVSSYPKSHLEWMYEAVPYAELETAKLASSQYNPIRIGWDRDQHRYERESFDYEYTRTTFHETGIRNALVIPIPTIGKVGPSGVSYFSRSTEAAFDQLIDERGDMMRLAGCATHVHIQSLRQSKVSRLRLSVREKECLLRLARGLRTKEISHKLNIKEVTVNLHITNARKKLSAATRDQAVAKAILNGLIEP